MEVMLIRRFRCARFCTVMQMRVVNGWLIVYDAVHLDRNGSLKVLWDSQSVALHFLFNKFDPPLIDGGQIYVPNYNGEVDVHRLVQ
jgi:hypothetical protein